MPDPNQAIDPYHMWLGIPKNQQPPTHYRLLGIEPFESDAEVIETAASRQVAYLHQLAAGPHRRLTQKLLNEIARARRTLLDDASREKYDERLRSKTPSSPPPVTDAQPKSQGQRSSGAAAAPQFPGIDTGSPSAAADTSQPVVLVDDNKSPSKAAPKNAAVQNSNTPKQAKSPVAATQKDSKPAEAKQPADDGPSFDFMAAPKKSKQTKKPAETKATPSSKSDLPKSKPAAKVPEEKPAEENAAPDFSSLNFGSPGKKETGKSSSGSAKHKVSKNQAPAQGKANGKADASSKQRAAAAKQPAKAAASGNEDADAEQSEEPKKRRGKKGLWHSNDWRIHVGISLISVIILVAYLWSRDTGGGQSGPSISAEDDPSRRQFDAPSMQNMDDKFDQLESP